MSGLDGVAFFTNSDGIITEVLDNAPAIQGLRPGYPFAELLPDDFRLKGKRFLESADASGAAYSWQIAIKTGDEGKAEAPWIFTALRLDGRMLIMGTSESESDQRYYEQMMRMNNENVNELRRLQKSRPAATTPASGEFELYNALSHLNNELTNAQRDLAKKSVELERSNRLKDQMLGMAAHDLRNPLSVVFHMASFLMDDRDADCLKDQHREFLHEIRNSSELMLSIVEDMLDISAIESGRIRLNSEKTDLNRLTEQVAGLFRKSAVEKGIGLSVELPELTERKSLDPHKMRRILVNLVSNAVKFSPSGTEITLTMKRAGKGGGVVWAVADQGPGIPEGEMGMLFQPFARISVESTAGEKSTGLGLAITRKLVEAHGGTITVESRVGSGTTFSVTIP